MSSIFQVLPAEIAVYRFERLIGEGGFAKVYEVEHLTYHQKFAAKVVSITSPKAADQFETECALLQQLDHPNIVKIYDFFRHEDNLIIILELCTGSIPIGKPLPTDLLVGYCAQIIAGLSACHSQRIAHRDLKPQNLLINRFGRVCISDFGLSSYLDTGTQSREKFGTYAYLAPEILHGIQYDPFAADCWALGVIIYQLTTSKLPWNRAETRIEMAKLIKSGNIEKPQNMPYKMWETVKSLLNVNPSRRMTINAVSTASFMSLRKSESTSTLPVDLCTNPMFMKRSRISKKQRMTRSPSKFWSTGVVTSQKSAKTVPHPILTFAPIY